jgi:ribosomal protein L11 methyltransferase
MPEAAPSHGASPPYTDLYIYYLSGVPYDKDFGNAYLGNWEEDGHSFLFFSRPCPERIDALIASEPHISLLDTYVMTYDQWQGGVGEPLRVGRFLICPPWRAPGKGTTDTLSLLLDPGLVFGTGTHPTTADCLRALELAFARRTPDTVLDLGTGTGVLALAAAKLGCRRVVAVDRNPLAARTALNNVSINNEHHRVLILCGRAEELVACRADLLVANIHFSVMDRLMAAPGFLEKGRYILSGLLRSEVRAVTDRIQKTGTRIVQTWNHESTWFTMYAEQE